MKDRTRARELAAEFGRRATARAGLKFFTRGRESAIPWADYHPTPHLVRFWIQYPQQTDGKSAPVVGCGLAPDAEQLAACGFRTTSFDISKTAIHRVRKGFPRSTVHSHAGNLLDPPVYWRGQFDFVLEPNTLQVLPTSLRSQATKNMARFLRPGGDLLVIARHREPFRL